MARGTHIRLYEVHSKGVQYTVKGGYESDEELHAHVDKIHGITKTQVRATSHVGRGGRDEEIVESFHHH